MESAQERQKDYFRGNRKIDFKVYEDVGMRDYSARTNFVKKMLREIQ